MSGQLAANLRPLAPGIILALVSIGSGFLLGGAFGAAEDLIKAQLRSFWLVAGLTVPSVGDMGEAKDALSFLAVPGAGLCLLGIGGTFLSVLRRLVTPPPPMRASTLLLLHGSAGTFMRLLINSHAGTGPSGYGLFRLGRVGGAIERGLQPPRRVERQS
jgi:hypothetical protein